MPMRDAELDARIREWRDAQRRHPSGWHRNIKGNLVTGSPSGKTMTVFMRYPGWFAWSISTGVKTWFSKCLYRREQDAQAAVEEEERRRRG